MLAPWRVVAGVTIPLLPSGIRVVEVVAAVEEEVVVEVVVAVVQSVQ